ncbi:hypothetical protein ACLE20_13280 [Rhizobium sp. YIM 134829]|uniref:hypothetical protein n=1 Tax=Rhizobium sp. YIM 134829 TaxID=3390453 RepID=UPI00397C3572
MPIDPNDIVNRLAYRAGRLDGRGWPFNWFVRKDIALHRESARVIEELRISLRKAVGA